MEEENSYEKEIFQAIAILSILSYQRTDLGKEQELIEDLVQIITVFSCKLQGKRANKAKKMIKEFLEDDNS